MINENRIRPGIRPHEENDSLNLRATLDKILGAWPWFLFSLVLGLSVAFLINRYAEPLYRAKTSMLVTEPKDVNNAVSEILYGQELFGGSVNMENEAYLLKSYALITSTLREMDFNITYYLPGKIRDEELYRNSPILLTTDETSTWIPYNSLMICNILDEESFSISFVKENILDRLKGVITASYDFEEQFESKVFPFGEEIDLNGFKFRIDYIADSPIQSKEIIFRIDDYNTLTGLYLENLKVVPLSFESSILEISIVTSHEQKGSDFINTLVETYIVDELERKNHTAERTIDFINDQIILMSDSLSSVESQMETFKRSNTDLTISSEGSNYLEKSQQYQEARNQLLLNNRYLSELEGYVNQNNLDEIVVPASIGIADPALNKSIQDLVNLQLQIQTIGSTKNPLVRSYQQRIEILKQGILENIKSLKTSNKLALNNINQQVGGMRTTLQNLPTAEREYINIQRKYNLSENLYLFLMEKKAEAGIAKASNTIDIRVIDKARRSFKPISPKPLFNYALAIIISLAIPLGILFISDMLNNKIRSKDELLKISSIPYLGLIARNKAKTTIITNGQVRTEVAETFRTIRSNLRYMMGNTEHGAKTFLLTSSVSAEGKSFCSNNLAVVFSNFGKKVLLIDADMRKEKDYQDFSVVDAIGLSDFLAGIASIHDIVKSTNTPNLSIITSGGIPPNPSELLISGKFELLLQQLKADYDYIVIDTPPIGILSDGLELIDKCDVTIFVAREGYTLKRHILDLNNIYYQRKVNNLAILLNAVNYSKSEYGGYGKYYNQYQNNTGKKVKRTKTLLTKMES